MSILDETGLTVISQSRVSNVVDHRIHIMFSRDTRIDVVIYVPCMVNCNVCIAHKHNISHGCPLCGNQMQRLLESSTYIYKCSHCESIVEICGGGDIKIIGIVNKMYVIEEDII